MHFLYFWYPWTINLVPLPRNVTKWSKRALYESLFWPLLYGATQVKLRVHGPWTDFFNSQSIIWWSLENDKDGFQMIRNIDCWEVLKSEKLYTAWETVNSVRCLQTGRHRDQKNTHQMELNEVSDIQKAVYIFHCQRYAFRSISKEKQKMNEISGRVKNEITVFGTLLSET